MKGMQKIRRGSGFLGVLSYLLDHDDPEIIAGTITGGNARQMTREYVALSKTRPDIAKPVWHNRNISIPELSITYWSIVVKPTI